MRILITGICSSLAQLLSDRLIEDGHEIIGVDYRHRARGMRKEITFYRANYNKRIIEEVFRSHPPEAVVHLGRVGNLKTTPNKRFDLNVMGSAKVMELSLKHKVQRLVVMSTFHIYGAHPHNHIPIVEEEPLRAGQTFPQLADAVQLDNQAATWIYRHRKLRTVVLRPCNVVGPDINNAISTYLRQRTQAYMLGYSPMWQFIHQEDMVQALILAVTGNAVGVYNVAGDGAMPVVEALSLTGSHLVPVPAPLASLALRLSGSLTIPPYFIDFLKYHCVISDDKFRNDFGYEPRIGLIDTIQSTTNRI